MPLRVAVVGAGAFGANHARALMSVENALLVALVDRDIERAHRLVSELNSNAGVYPDLEIAAAR